MNFLLQVYACKLQVGLIFKVKSSSKHTEGFFKQDSDLGVLSEMLVVDDRV